MLQVEHLSVSYRGIQALQGVSFELPPGLLMGLLGPNGAGKSTLVKAMLGLVTPTEGRVRLDGKPLRWQLSRLAYIPQKSQIDWDYPITVWNFVMTARTVETGLFRRPSQQVQHQAKAALERMEIADLRDRPIGALSGGQKQRTFLARALAKQADVFFLDEPFTGVDRKTEDIIFDVFDDLKQQGKTLLVINHDLGERLNRYDRLMLMNRKPIAIGTKPDVMTADNLAAAYGRPLELAAA